MSPKTLTFGLLLAALAIACDVGEAAAFFKRTKSAYDKLDRIDIDKRKDIIVYCRFSDSHSFLTLKVDDKPMKIELFATRSDSFLTVEDAEDAFQTFSVDWCVRVLRDRQPIMAVIRDRELLIDPKDFKIKWLVDSQREIGGPQVLAGDCKGLVTDKNTREVLRPSIDFATYDHFVRASIMISGPQATPI